MAQTGGAHCPRGSTEMEKLRGGECEMMKADLEASLSASCSSAIQCRDVCRSYGKLRVLSSLNLTVTQGQ
ncbi:ABC transporter G family member 23 isoform X1, partial [Tachysurus ichikawai]